MNASEGPTVARRRRIVVATGLMGVLTCAVLVVVGALQTDTTAGGRDHIRAVLEGQPIRARDVSRYHCHDLEYPVIRCFRNASDRDADVAAHEARR